MVRTALGTPPVCDPDRVFSADGRSCSEGDRLELSYRFHEVIARLEPAPGAPGWLQVLRESEGTEHSHRGAGSTEYRKKAAKGVIAEHIVSLALHHGLLLATADCVLLHDVEERAAQIAAGTFDIGAGATNTAPAAQEIASTPTNTLATTGGNTESAAGATPEKGGAGGAKPGQAELGGIVDGPGDRALVDLVLKQHRNHEVCRTSNIL